jgi:hypothetical protein
MFVNKTLFEYKCHAVNKKILLYERNENNYVVIIQYINKLNSEKDIENTFKTDNESFNFVLNLVEEIAQEVTNYLSNTNDSMFTIRFNLPRVEKSCFNDFIIKELENKNIKLYNFKQFTGFKFNHYNQDDLCVLSYPNYNFIVEKYKIKPKIVKK